MNKLVLSCALLVAGLIGSTSNAQSAPAACGFEFQVTINSFFLVSNGSGTGLVSCADAGGVVVEQVPVNIYIEGVGPGLGSFEMHGYSGSVGITQADQIEGDFAVVQANVGLGAALGASVGFVGQRTGLSFTAGLKGGHGLGVMLNGTTWHISIAQ